MEKPLTAVSAIVSIVLAIVIASHHGIRFGKGLGGYLLGNLLATLTVLPLTMLPTAIARPLTAFWVQLTLILVYAAVLTVAIVYKRRQALSRRRRQALVEPFA